MKFTPNLGLSLVYSYIQYDIPFITHRVLDHEVTNLIQIW